VGKIAHRCVSASPGATGDFAHADTPPQSAWATANAVAHPTAMDYRDGRRRKGAIIEK
jgi:hypothetical protein